MDGTGSRGEALASRYLARRGWRILARNWVGGGGELDLVALRAGIVAFVEVKSRSDSGTLDDPVTIAQRRRWINAARAFLSSRSDLERVTARFDVIAIDASRRHRRIRHLPDVLGVEPEVGNPIAAAAARLGGSH